MKGDERLERANKRTNEHLAKLVKANVEKAEAEKKAKLDKDMEVDTGVGERHGASSSTEMATGSGTKRDIDTDDGDAMIDVETSNKKMRVNKVVEVVPVKAVVNEMDEESMDDVWGYGLEADEWVVQDWEKCEKELAEARDEEVKYMVEKLNMFEFYSEDDMKAITSEAPTSTKWVDVRKMNDDGEEFMRSRLVARDFRPRRGPDRPDLFAAMPPLEAKKMLFIMTVAGGAFEQRGSKDEQKLMFIDVRKAHLNGVVDDQEWVFVELPPEFHVYGRFARIRRWLYGMRKAAISWEKNYAEKLAAVGFKGSRAAPTTFYNPATKVRLVVHGDDFTFSGTQVELEKIRGLFKKWYDVKDRGIMGSGTRDIKEVVISGRTLKFTEMGLEYTADGKHRDAILEELGLESESKSLGCPALGRTRWTSQGMRMSC